MFQSNFVHFADDSTVYARGECLESLVGRVNDELARVDIWLCSNRLSLNVTKSSFTVYTNRRVGFSPVIKIRDRALLQVNCVKFLGVHIDDKLNFSHHIDSVCSKVSRSLSILFHF